MKLNITNPKLNILSLTLLAALATGGQAWASECKGLSQSDCGGNSACSWVDSYTRSDGKTVNGYCRTATTGKKEQESDKKTAKATASK